VAPGPPVYITTEDVNGNPSCRYRSSQWQDEQDTEHLSRPTPQSSRASDVSDQELDALIAGVLAVFPQFGRCMITGRLVAQGYHIPREHIRALYLRVHGAPSLFWFLSHCSALIQCPWSQLFVARKWPTQYGDHHYPVVVLILMS
jgi:hypothetical protein